MKSALIAAFGAHPGLLYGFVILMVLALFLKPLRDLLRFLFSAPAQIIATRIWFLFTSLLKAHLLVFKNLVTPRSIIFPTLDKKRTKK